MSIDEIRANTAKAREAMIRARKEQFALGAFNLDNQESLIAVVRAAAGKKAPLIVELSKTEVDMIGYENARDLVDNYKRQYGLEMYLNLDHSPTFEDCLRAIKAGFEMVHIDISQANHDATDEEIIAETKKVVEAAKETGALIEAEPHYFLGGSNKFEQAIDYEEIKKTFSTPEGSLAFVNATGIDIFAAAVGNLHGSYPVPKILDLELLQKIRDILDCNISLHGGSDTPSHYFREAVRIGVSKININTDMRIAYRTTLERMLEENKTEYAVIKLMDEVIAAVQKVVESKLADFNAAGKARP